MRACHRGDRPRPCSLSDGRRIASRLVVWTAGTSPHPLLGELPCPRTGADVCGRDPGVKVARRLGARRLRASFRTAGPEAVIRRPRSTRSVKPRRRAQHRRRDSRRGTRVPFDFRTIGQLAAIGRRTGVARIFGVNFSGFIAWWLWRTIYLSKLPRFEKKLRVAIDWTLDLLFAKDFVQFLTQLTSDAFAAKCSQKRRSRPGWRVKLKSGRNLNRPVVSSKKRADSRFTA